MQPLSLLAVLFSLSLALAQTTETVPWRTTIFGSPNATTTIVYGNTAAICQQSPNCLQTVKRLDECNDTVLDETDRQQAFEFFRCLCSPNLPEPFTPFNTTWFLCLQCYVDELGFDEGVVANAQKAWDFYCLGTDPNVTSFNDYQYLVLVAGWPWTVNSWESHLSYSRWHAGRGTTVRSSEGSLTAQAGGSATAGVASQTTGSTTNATADTTATTGPATTTMPASTAGATARKNAAVAQREIVRQIRTVLLVAAGLLVVQVATVAASVWL